MVTRYEIHPSIGVARIGNSHDGFYLAPELLGGLPAECDPNGNPVVSNGRPDPVGHFKDNEGCIRRQGAQFKIFAYDDARPDDPGREVTLDDDEIESMEWTVHLANKKAAWYRSSELAGDLMLGEQNSYQSRHVPLRNPGMQGERERQPLIIDPGPRTVNQPDQEVSFSRDNIPHSYPFGSFPDPKLTPYPINTLGALLMDAAGRLVVLGGFGNACGEEILATFTGENTWYDDVSDGPVYCQLRLKGRPEAIQLKAWVIVGPPKFAPELRNISTLSDVMYDVGVRFMGLVPELYDATRWPDGWNPDYEANYERDIQPTIERPADYIWVANIPSMVAFSAPKFDPTDTSEANRQNRQNYVSYFRQPGDNELAPQHQELMSPNGIPMMPLNAGSNPVSNRNIDKFLSLTQTQYRLLKQWAAGKFTAGKAAPNPPGIHALDQASVGNCVGHPMSPGIEVSWNTRNPIIYERPYRFLHRFDESYFQKNGLSASHDECTGEGCEPGDLTKRMSPPWQADFYQCTVEYINFTDPNSNLDFATGIPTPPTYYTYWWPPQAPMYVMSGGMTIKEQQDAGVSAGYQVYFLRGAPNISLLVECWKYMGFVLNQNTGADRRDYPYFVERERNHDKFTVASVAVAMPINQLAASGSYLTEDNYFQPVWYLKASAGNPGAARRNKG
jgi:L-lysine 6-oxidase